MPDSIPMPWLGRPADTQLAGQSIGGVIGGVLRSTRKDVRQGRSFMETLPQGIEEGMGLAQDPQYTLKKAQLQASILGIGARYEAQLRQAQIQQQQIVDESQDQQFLTDSVARHAGNPEMILESLQSFVPKSARGSQGASQIRMAATQGLQRNLSQKMNSEFVQALSKLSDPTVITGLMTDAYDANGLVKPEKLSVALAEANRTKSKEFAPTKEEKLLNAYRRSLDDGDIEAADFYKSRMTTADDRMQQTLKADLEKQYQRKDVELQGLRAAVAELERNPRAKVMMTEEASLLARRRSQLAAAEEEFKALGNHRQSFLAPAPAAAVEQPAPQPSTNAPAADPLGLFK